MKAHVGLPSPVNVMPIQMVAAEHPDPYCEPGGGCPTCNALTPPPNANAKDWIAIELPPDITPACRAACEYLADVARLIIAKNAAYGSSAENPMRIFSKVDAATGTRVRIDDKLSRLARGAGEGGSDEDTRKDLVGYCALLHGIEVTQTEETDEIRP